MEFPEEKTPQELRELLVEHHWDVEKAISAVVWPEEAESPEASPRDDIKVLLFDKGFTLPASIDQIIDTVRSGNPDLELSVAVAHCVARLLELQELQATLTEDDRAENDRAEKHNEGEQQSKKVAHAEGAKYLQRCAKLQADNEAGEKAAANKQVRSASCCAFSLTPLLPAVECRL